MKLVHALLAGSLAIMPVTTALAQDAATVEALTPLLSAEDRKQFDDATFRRAITDPNPLVRRTAAMVMARIGNKAAVPFTLQLLLDQDQGVIGDAMFALGILGDTSAVGPIAARLRARDSLSADATTEAAAALARIGGPEAVRLLADGLAGSSTFSPSRRAAFVSGALIEAWRLGVNAPRAAMLPYASDTSVDWRWRAVYSLGRLRAPEAGTVILSAARDREPLIRAAALKALTRRFADTAHLPLPTVSREVARAFDDADAGARVNAVDAAATLGDTALVPRVARLLTDLDPNVRVAAANALATMGGTGAARELGVLVRKRDAPWGVRRAALMAIARTDTAAFRALADEWTVSFDPRDRIAAIDAWGSSRVADPAVFRNALQSGDVRLQTAALEAWTSASPRGDSGLTRAARGLLLSSDPQLRAAAASVMVRGSTADDIQPLLAAWKLAADDADGDARGAVIRALAGIARRDSVSARTLRSPSTLLQLTATNDQGVRSFVAESWPELAATWGVTAGVSTGRTIDDYRNIVRTLMLAPQNPRVTVELETKGTIVIELLGRDAPLTVANFLRLVDRRYYDGLRWHRVVPNFVIQTGDRTGAGSAVPPIRNEVNRRHYDVPMAGIADAGLDTGSAQWFINVSPQPHLDGRYTIFGTVVDGYNGMRRVVQGDVIRSIHR